MDGERGISKHTHTNSPIAWLAAMTDGGVQLTGVAMETSIGGSLSFSTLSGDGELHTHSAEECSVGSRSLSLVVYDFFFFLLLCNKSALSVHISGTEMGGSNCG